MKAADRFAVLQAAVPVPTSCADRFLGGTSAWQDAGGNAASRQLDVLFAAGGRDLYTDIVLGREIADGGGWRQGSPGLGLAVNSTLLFWYRYAAFAQRPTAMFFAFQIYIDFSAFSDMAVGLARVFGNEHRVTIVGGSSMEAIAA